MGGGGIEPEVVCMHLPPTAGKLVLLVCVAF